MSNEQKIWDKALNNAIHHLNTDEIAIRSATRWSRCWCGIGWLSILVGLGLGIWTSIEYYATSNEKAFFTSLGVLTVGLLGWTAGGLLERHYKLKALGLELNLLLNKTNKTIDYSIQDLEDMTNSTNGDNT